MTAATLKPHVLTFLRGTEAANIREIAIALDIHNEMGDLRACVDGLRRHKKIVQFRDSKGITCYCLPESPASLGASANPVATAAEEAAPESHSSASIVASSPSKAQGDEATQEIHKREYAQLVRTVDSQEASPEPALSKPAVGYRIPFGLLDRIEAISTDIEDVLGDAFDIDGVPTPALKSLTAANGAIHRALRAFYAEATV